MINFSLRAIGALLKTRVRVSKMILGLRFGRFFQIQPNDDSDWRFSIPTWVTNGFEWINELKG